jgi:hypothetical protein
MPSFSTIYLFVDTFLTAALFLFVFGYLKMSWSVRGSHGRYVGRTICRATQWLALADQVLDIIDNTVSLRFWIVPFNIYNIYWISKSIREFYDSDEDDWFKGRKKKIAKWVRGKLESARDKVPQLSPEPGAVFSLTNR